MRRLIWVLVIGILGTGCKSDIPEDVIKPDKMQEVLYDIHVVDGYISTIYIQDSARKVAAAYYKGIYKKFGTDSAQYAKSMEYYYKNPEDLEKMYKNISKRLDQQKVMMQKADSLNMVKKRKADSIKNSIKSKPVLKKADSLKISRKRKLIMQKTQPLNKLKSAPIVQ